MATNYYLKPCPFCGGVAKLEDGTKGYAYGEEQKLIYVRCTKCWARSGRKVISDYLKAGVPRKQAIIEAVESWNNRIDDNEVMENFINGEYNKLVARIDKLNTMDDRERIVKRSSKLLKIYTQEELEDMGYIIED